MTDANEVLLFDFWGVIGIVQSPYEIRHMASMLGTPFDAFVEAYWAERHPYDAGEPAAAYWGRVAARTGASLDPQLLAALVARDTGSWRRVDPVMVDLLAELADAGRRLALLSNAPRELAGFVRESAAGTYLEPMVFSCDLGLAKPDAAIYERTLEILGVSAADVLFIDDRQVNVDAARTVGMRGLLHTSVAATRAALLAPA